MRRLIVIVAVAAAALLAPSAAFATNAPVLVGPTSPTNAPTIDLSWNDVRPVPGVGSVSYQVQRAPLPCAEADFGADGPPAVDAFTFSEATPPDGTYCYRVIADDGLTGPSLPSNVVQVTVDRTVPQITSVAQTGGDGCLASLTLTGAVVNDASAVSLTANGTAFSPGAPYVLTTGGAPFDLVTVNVVATDAAGNPSAPFPVTGRILDTSGPGATSLEVTTDPVAQRATLNWAPSVNDGSPVSYKLRTKGPQGVSTTMLPGGPYIPPMLQADATYEFTLEPIDQCGRSGGTSVRLVRLNDTTPPSLPIVAAPAFNPVSHVVALSWGAATDNIQVDHYEILRNGVPLGATDSTVYVDAVPPQHTQVSYVVRAVDTNGNSTESAPASTFIPDWQPPTAPVLTVSMSGTTATLRWNAAADNIGVVGYDVIRDGKTIASMTASVRTYKDVNVPSGTRIWMVRARDDAGLTATSAGQTQRVVKSRSRVSVVGAHLVGHGRSAARYSLKARARLLVDLHVSGTITRAKLRIYVNSGRTRITAWRGTPGTSAPRLRLGSAVARHGYVSIKLARPLHTGRIRLVLITSGKLVIAGTGAHAPSVKAS